MPPLTDRTIPLPPVNPQNPATWLKPDEPLLDDDGRDWSWAYIWFKDIEGFPGYKVGTDGSIWSALYPRGHRPYAWRRLSLHHSHGNAHKGYLHVILRRNLKNHTRQVHTLVLRTFAGPPPPGMTCCHGPRGKWDNRLSNIRWGTPRENNADKLRDGTLATGERHGRAILCWRDVAKIRERASRGETGQAIAMDYPTVCYGTIVSL